MKFIFSHILISIFFAINCYAQTIVKDSKTPLLPPVFSHSGGFYTTSFNLILSSLNTNDTIFYTTDGSEPDRNSIIFDMPLLIESRTGDTNVISIIPTNFLQTGLWAYETPSGEIFKATVIKARCFSGSETPSEIITHTYFVDTLIAQRYNLPVISLSTNNYNFFSDSIGIYVPGINYTGNNNSGNYFETGSLWERPVFFEYFTNDGLKVYEQDANVRIHGGDTRLLPQKALRLYADSTFDYPFFLDKDIQSFKTLVLRNSGNDNTATMFRDIFMSSLVRDMGSGLEYQAGQAVVVFINGEYWGIHNLRERIDKYFIGNNAQVNPNNIDYLEKHGLVKEGDNLDYFEWYNFLESADMTQSSAYNYMAGKIDIQNFTDYNIAQIYFSNIDWPGNNRDYWRTRLPEGKWRWIPYDTDFGFGLETYSHYDNNTLVFATTPNGPTSPPAWNTNPPYATLQLRKMLQNENFRNDFLNRTADLLNTTFSSNNVINRINAFEQLYEYVMPEHIERWRKPQNMNDWYQYVSHLKQFAENRPAFIYTYIFEYFNEVETLSQDITDTSKITVNVPDTLMGHVLLSTLRPHSYPFTGLYFHNVPVPLKAIPKTGYKFKEWAETGTTNPEITISLSSDTLFTAIFETDSNYIPKLLFINEFMASNISAIQDAYGAYEDWIEIYNPNPDTIDIAGFFITDNFSQPDKHQFTSGSPLTKIPPYEFKVLWADGTPAKGPLHLGFKLSGNGEVIGLYDDSLNGIDHIIFGVQNNNESYGRFPDGYNNWHFMTSYSPGSPNVTTFIQSSEKNTEIIIFPNPAHSDFLFLSEKAETIKIFNIHGQCIFEVKNTSQIDISSLNKGVYFISINNFLLKKFVVQ